MALPGVVKRFEVKSHQIWAQYLQPVRNGGRLSPRGGYSSPPPHWLGLSEESEDMISVSLPPRCMYIHQQFDL